MKKIYTIKITGAKNSEIWYSNKIDRVFEGVKASGSVPGFIVRGVLFFVHEADCKVISERVEEKYYSCSKFI